MIGGGIFQGRNHSIYRRSQDESVENDKKEDVDKQMDYPIEARLSGFCPKEKNSEKHESNIEGPDNSAQERFDPTAKKIDEHENDSFEEL